MTELEWIKVSTHSRLKAAGGLVFLLRFTISGFNTQPPEGGWLGLIERAWKDIKVSTHSRVKAAGGNDMMDLNLLSVSTHSRLKAAGPVTIMQKTACPCFNTQPPEGGWKCLQ